MFYVKTSPNSRWQEIDEADLRAALAQTHGDVEAAIEKMRSDTPVRTETAVYKAGLDELDGAAVDAIFSY